MVTELLYKSASEPVNRSFEIAMAAILSTIYSIEKSSLDLPILMKSELRNAKETSKVTFGVDDNFQGGKTYTITIRIDSAKEDLTKTISLAISKKDAILRYKSGDELIEEIKCKDNVIDHHIAKRS